MRFKRLLALPLALGIGTILFAPLPASIPDWRSGRPPASIEVGTDRRIPKAAPRPGVPASRRHSVDTSPFSAQSVSSLSQHAHAPSLDTSPFSAQSVSSLSQGLSDFLAALEAYRRGIVRSPGDPEVEQSSVRFVDFPEPQGPGIAPPTDQTLMDREGLWKACDPTSTAYTDTTDGACLRYLSNRHNMRDLKPMAAVLSSARTLKYRVTYRHGDPPLGAILKVPQKKFLFEPSAELIGFAVDRILGINRVPPTAWVELPLTWLQASATAMPPLYMRWLQQFVFDSPDVAPAIRTDGADKVLGVSVQLWMSDVHGAYQTTMAPPGDCLAYLRGDKPITPEVNATLAEISDLFVFDFVISNQDRSLGKNNFAVGGCLRGCDAVPTTQRHKGPPQLIHLDQGSAFYRRPGPSGNPLTAHSHGNSSFCRFRKPVWEKMAALRSGKNRPKGQTLWRAIQRRVPAAVIDFVKEPRVHAAQDRLDYIVRHTEQHCFARDPRDTVLAFD